MVSETLQEKRDILQDWQSNQPNGLNDQQADYHGPHLVKLESKIARQTIKWAPGDKSNKIA